MTDIGQGLRLLLLTLARRDIHEKSHVPHTAMRRRARLPAWRCDEREPRTDISQVELQLHGLRDAPRRGLHQLRREDRGADPWVRPRRTRRRAVLGRLPRGDRAVLLHATRALARAAYTT